MRQIALLLLLSAHFALAAQLPLVGNWRAFPTTGVPIKAIDTPNKVYYLARSASGTIAYNNLFSYNKNDNSLETLTKLEGLNDEAIADIAYSDKDKVLFIAYINGNFDLLTPRGIYNIPDFRNETSIKEKQINSITFAQGKAFLGLKSGLMVINLAKREIKETYLFNRNILFGWEMNGKTYAVDENNTYSWGDNKDNLLDISKWKQLNTVSGPPHAIALFDTGVMLGCNDAVQRLNNDHTFTQNIIPNLARMLPYEGGILVTLTNNTLARYDQSETLKETLSLSELPLVTFTDITYNPSKNNYWGVSSKGITGFKADNGTPVITVQEAAYNSSAITNPFHLTFGNGRLYVTESGLTRYIGNEYDRTVISVFENERWSLVDTQQLPLYNKTPGAPNYMACPTSIAISPSEPNSFYIGSFFEGLYKFTNNRYDTVYHADKNALLHDGLGPFKPLLQAGPNVYRTHAPTFDRAGNLWVTAYNNVSGDSRPLVVRKADGTWTWLNYPELTIPNVGRNMEAMLTSRYSNSNVKWIINRFNYAVDGVTPLLFAFDDKGTIDNINDDTKQAFTSFTDQDGNTFISPLLCFAEDRTGQIWIGSQKGIYLINTPSRVFDSNFRVTRPKINRNDGSNLADYLLETEMVSAILVDGANRKWIGTMSGGVYLLSPDGQQTLEHFTTENSPLPSDEINNLAINPETGELFIGTTKGLVSYRNTATEGRNDYESVYAFPNPVRPDYEGWITVTGLMENSLVKITDVAGNILFQAYSTGGQCVWDGRNALGNRVAAGIYMVLVNKNGEKEGVATQIAVIR